MIAPTANSIELSGTRPFKRFTIMAQQQSIQTLRNRTHGQGLRTNIISQTVALELLYMLIAKTFLKIAGFPRAGHMLCFFVLCSSQNHLDTIDTLF